MASRVKGAIYGLAVCDALGGPVEFKARGSFAQVTTMLPNANFGLPAGCFTDDTSMMLFLAHSLLEFDGQSNVVDQVKKYIAWWRDGFMSSVGECFDIGVSTQSALALWETLLDPGGRHDTPLMEEVDRAILKKVSHHFADEKYCGNGSLMRVLSAALIASSVSNAINVARESSAPTHPHLRCVNSCMAYAWLVQHALDGVEKEELALGLSKWINDIPSDLSEAPMDTVLVERIGRYQSLQDWTDTPIESIRSTGYVVDTLEASLWAFFRSISFADAAIKAVNLGDDADTVGAICGGLAGSYYGFEAIPEDWLLKMKKKELLDELVERIIAHKSRTCRKY